MYVRCPHCGDASGFVLDEETQELNDIKCFTCDEYYYTKPFKSYSSKIQEVLDLFLEYSLIVSNNNYQLVADAQKELDILLDIKVKEWLRKHGGGIMMCPHCGDSEGFDIDEDDPDADCETCRTCGRFFNDDDLDDLDQLS